MEQSDINIFLTDENVEGPAIEIARAMGVQIIRDVDTDIPCDIQFYDQCLTDYAVANGYIIVTANIDVFAPLYRQMDSHPGAVFIAKNSRRSHQHIAECRKLLENDDLRNKIEWI